MVEGGGEASEHHGEAVGGVAVGEDGPHAVKGEELCGGKRLVEFEHVGLIVEDGAQLLVGAWVHDADLEESPHVRLEALEKARHVLAQLPLVGRLL